MILPSIEFLEAAYIDVECSLHDPFCTLNDEDHENMSDQLLLEHLRLFDPNAHLTGLEVFVGEDEAFLEEIEGVWINTNEDEKDSWTDNWDTLYGQFGDYYD